MTGDSTVLPAAAEAVDVAKTGDEGVTIPRAAWWGFLLLLPLVAVLTYLASERYARSALYESAGTELELFALDLAEEIEKYSFLPRVIARTGQVQAALTRGAGLDDNALNQHLEYVNAVSGAEDSYLLDLHGVAIATSNWNLPHSFLGKSYTYRPYYQQAIDGVAGRYFALGTASGKRGYYFSAPVRDVRNQVLGVAVVKVGIDRIEQSWGDYRLDFLIADENGVVFSSNQPDWHFSTLRPLAEPEKDRIERDRQYPLAVLKPFPRRGDHELTNGSRIAVLGDKALDGAAGEYLLRTETLPALGWRIYALADWQPVTRTAIAGSLTALSFAGLLGLLALGLWLRRAQLKAQFAFRDRTEKALLQARDRLEERVAKRTQALQTTNQALERENAERREAEARLREAQAELVHAAQLATVGKLSSGISHELNQPLAAIGHYADNAKKLLAAGNASATAENLQEIAALSERTAQITAQLKAYSRKTDDEVEAVALEDVINHALVLLQSRIRTEGVEVELNLLPEAQVMANAVRLEQVFVNLMSNALDAIYEAAEQDAMLPRRLLVEQALEGAKDETIVTRVHDSGGGIADELADQVFDSFYTTKPVGVGLGLGLSISSNIVKSYGGSLKVGKQARLEGACFSVRLGRV